MKKMIMVVMEWMVAAALLSGCALAQSGGSTTGAIGPFSTPSYVASQTVSPSSTSSPPPSPSPTPSPSIPPHTSTPMPSPTPTPTPPPIPDETYKFDGPDGNVCIHMKAGLEVTLDYPIENGTASTILEQLSSNLTVDHNNSFCNTTFARLVLVDIYDQHINFIFTFNDTTNNVTWQDGNTTFQYDTQILPGYDHRHEHEYDKIEFGDGILFDSQNPRIEMQRSYKCDRNQSFNGTSELTNITATLNVTGFQVQVFQFYNNASNGTFDNARNCDGGTTSQIVPIAVGAALAGLVIVVLIAYLIGRFRNRKQSSYEALS